MSILESAVNQPEKSKVIRQLPQIYVSGKALEELATRNYKAGITYKDVMKEFKIGKNHAQDTLNRALCNILFTLRRTRPQRYHPSSKRAEVLESKSKAIEATGYTLQTTPLDEAKADNFLQTLNALPDTPLAIHKIRLETMVDSEVYDDVRAPEARINRTKIHKVPLKRGLVSYMIHHNGRIQIDIACSDDPFPVSEISDLFAFFGQVRTILLELLSDPHERITPELMTWTLTRCDLNHDVPITDKAQLSLPAIQLIHAERVFRLYVKPLGAQAFYRIEEAVKPKEPIGVALAKIMKSN